MSRLRYFIQGIRSWFSSLGHLPHELFRRRVPHFLAAYLLACWAFLESLDWIVQRYGLSAHVVDAALVALLSMVPTVLIIAYNHGARGGQAWTPVEKIGVPVNLLVTVGIILAFFSVHNVGGVRSSIDFRARDWILVADFAGPVDVPSLGPTVRDLIIAGLNQSDFLTTVPRDQIRRARRAASIPDSLPLDAILARDLAYRTSVRVILAGNISRLGTDTYSITLRVVDVEDGVELHSKAIQTTLSADELIGKIDELVQDIREKLGENRDAIRASRPLVEVRTPSQEAFHKYAQASELSDQGDFAGSNVLLREALAIDTGFAAARAVMGGNFLALSHVDSARVAFEEALARPERLSDVERYRLHADLAYVNHDLVAAVRWYNLVLSQRPNAISARNNRAFYLSSLGRHEEALQELERAVNIDPFQRGPRQIEVINLVAELIVVGKLDSARAAIRRLEARPFVDWAELMELNATNAWMRAAERGREIGTNPSTPSYVRVFALTSSAAGLAAQGAVDAARRVLALAADTSAGQESRWYQRANLLLARTAGYTGGQLPRTAKADSSAGADFIRGLLALEARDTAGAWQRLNAIRARDPEQQVALGTSPAFLEACIHMAADRWDEVIALLGARAWRGEHHPLLEDRVDSFSLRWLVAEAHARLGALDSAVAYLELAVRPVYLPPQAYSLRGLVYPFAHYRIAQWKERLARTEEVGQHWRLFLESFRRPDAEFADMVAHARARSQGADASH